MSGKVLIDGSRQRGQAERERERGEIQFGVVPTPVHEPRQKCVRRGSSSFARRSLGPIFEVHETKYASRRRNVRRMLNTETIFWSAPDFRVKGIPPTLKVFTKNLLTSSNVLSKR